MDIFKKKKEEQKKSPNRYFVMVFNDASGICKHIEFALNEINAYDIARELKLQYLNDRVLSGKILSETVLPSIKLDNVDFEGI